MKERRINVATCQVSTSSSVGDNLAAVLAQMRAAKSGGADVAHFPEACLSGYAGADIASHEGLDWTGLAGAVREVMALAARLRLWVVIGAAHRLTAPNKPHNSLYVIDDAGRLVDRYDKRFCSGDASGQTGDLRHYTPGDHFSVFDIAGVRCGAMICVDCRYPELYRGYKRRGVELVFHSFHSGAIAAEDFASREAMVGAENFAFNATTTLPGITQPAMIHAAAGSNYFWISCANSSAPRTCWASFFVRPDGVATGRLELEKPGVLISRVNTAERFYNSTAAWRARAMDGVLHSGELALDPRSEDRTSI